MYHGRLVSEPVDDDDEEVDEPLGAAVQRETEVVQRKEEGLAVVAVGAVVATETWPPQSQEEASHRIVEDEVGVARTCERLTVSEGI